MCFSFSARHKLTFGHGPLPFFDATLWMRMCGYSTKLAAIIKHCRGKECRYEQHTEILDEELQPSCATEKH